MSNVKVQIPIREGLSGDNHLLETIYDMDFLPNVGDLFHPCKNDPESGLTFEVNRRYWMEDGSVILTVARHIIDPEEYKKVPELWHTWWSERDGNLVDLLLKNGWWPYGTQDS